MNKFLRYSLSVVLAFVASIGFAQTIIWSENFSNYEAGDVPTGGIYNYVCVDGGSTTKVYDANLAGGEAPELLVGKKSGEKVGSFSTTIKLNGAKGNATLAFKANKEVTVTATNATVGEVSKTGNDYLYPVTIADGATEITITISSATTNNTRLDNIKFYQGTAKKPAGLSWGTASREVTIGTEGNSFPTLSNANNLTVTYSSSKPEVATIAADGTITLVAAGETDITAKFAGNDEFEAGEVTYALTVKAASTVDLTNTPETAYTVTKAIELITAGEGLDTKVYVKGKISSIKEVSTKYGNATYNISDDGTDTNTITVFRGYSLSGEKFTSANEIKVGDEVVVYGKLVDYNGTKEISTGNNIYSINGATTGISNITTNTAAKDATIYNLAGQKVTKSYKGVVIKAGKKMIQ